MQDLPNCAVFQVLPGCKEQSTVRGTLSTKNLGGQGKQQEHKKDRSKNPLPTLPVFPLPSSLKNRSSISFLKIREKKGSREQKRRRLHGRFMDLMSALSMLMLQS